MPARAANLQHLLASGQVWQGRSRPLTAPAAWAFPELAGRLVELVGTGASATLTAAVQLLLEAQQRREPAAWLSCGGPTFYPPDIADLGVDLRALAVVRLGDGAALLRAADQLLRAGAFGLVVMDLGGVAEVPLPVQVRLAGLAKRHATAVVCLMAERRSPVGSFASLRAVSTRRRLGEGRFQCGLCMVKDKRRGGEWQCEQVLRGPMGLC